MNFFLYSLVLRLKCPRTWLFMVLLPLTVLGAARLMPPEEVSAPVQVGVVLPEQGGEDFRARLEARSGSAVTFRRADEARALGQVASGGWDCALILPEDFEDRLSRLDLAGLFTLLVGPGSTVYPLVQETAAACAAECAAPGMAEDYLLRSGIVETEQLEGVRPRLQETLLERDRVMVRLETADGSPLDRLELADRGVSNLLTGLTAILLLVWTMLTAMDLGRWLESPAARRLAPLRSGTALLLPRLAGELIPALCAGGLALLAAGAPVGAVPALVPYLMFWGGAALLLARWTSGWSALPALLPFVPVLGLLLSPVLLNLSLLIPALGPAVRWNPVSLYLRACGGSLPDALLLGAMGGGFLILSVGADRKNI